jgi:REP element-mobilizing transposase RayT
MRFSKEGGFSNPPLNYFLNPHAPIDRHKRRLPHWQQGSIFYFLTWRLADSLPLSKLNAWKSEREVWLSRHPEPWNVKTDEEYHERFSRMIDEWLDRGEGSCLLRNIAYSTIVAKAILHFDGERYTVASFVIMPNHVHVLFRLHDERRLEEIVKSWKGFTAKEINGHMNKSGSFWQADYWDRLIRNPGHFSRCLEYVRENPAKANLEKNEFVVYEGDEDLLREPLTNNGGQESPPSV